MLETGRLDQVLIIDLAVKLILPQNVTVFTQPRIKQAQCFTVTSLQGNGTGRKLLTDIQRRLKENDKRGKRGVREAAAGLYLREKNKFNFLKYKLTNRGRYRGKHTREKNC